MYMACVHALSTSKRKADDLVGPVERAMLQLLAKCKSQVCCCTLEQPGTVRVWTVWFACVHLRQQSPLWALTPNYLTASPAAPALILLVDWQKKLCLRRMAFGALSALRQQLQQGPLSATPTRRVRKRVRVGAAGSAADSGESPVGDAMAPSGPASPQSTLRNQCLLAERLGLPDLPTAEKDIMKEHCVDVLTRMAGEDVLAPCLLHGLLQPKGRGRPSALAPGFEDASDDAGPWAAPS